MNQNNNPNHNKNKIPNQKLKDAQGNEFEFSEELFDASGQVGNSPITGGLKTRKLVEEAEKFLINNKINKNT